MYNVSHVDNLIFVYTFVSVSASNREYLDTRTNIKDFDNIYTI